MPETPNQIAASPAKKFGRPKDLGKQQAILDAARAVFLAHGFTHATMDDIAQKAGVSKITLYNHFKDKDRLFQAMVTQGCNASGAECMEGLAKHGAKRALTQVAENFMAMILSDDALAMHRVVVPETQTNPALGQLLYEAGPKRMKEALAQLLKALVQQGELKIADPLVAASQFLFLCKGELHFVMHINLPKPDDTELKKHIRTTVATFLRAYAPQR